MRVLTKLAAVAVVALMTSPAYAALSPTPLDQEFNLGVQTTTGIVYDHYFSTDGDIDAAFYGNIAANTKITFVYSLSDVTSGVDSAKLKSTGSTVTSISANNYNVYTSVKLGAADSEKPSSDGLVLAGASLPSLTQGKTTVINLTQSELGFRSEILAFLDGTARLHVVATITPVPLPAALPLFGAGLLGLAGLRRRNKQMI